MKRTALALIAAGIVGVTALALPSPADLGYGGVTRIGRGAAVSMWHGAEDGASERRREDQRNGDASYRRLAWHEHPAVRGLLPGTGH